MISLISRFRTYRESEVRVRPSISGRTSTQESIWSIVLVDQPRGMDDLPGSSTHPIKFSTSLPSFSSNQQNRSYSSSVKRPAAMPNIAAHPYETPSPSMSTTVTDPAEFVIDDASIFSSASIRLDEQWKLLCFWKNIQIRAASWSPWFKNTRAGRDAHHFHPSRTSRWTRTFSRFQKPLHVSELYTMKHVIDIQDFGGKRVARLLPTFRSHFDEVHRHVRLSAAGVAPFRPITIDI